jgi:hypothetical protein
MALYAGSVLTNNAGGGAATPIADLKATSVGAGTAVLEVSVFYSTVSSTNTLSVLLGRAVTELFQYGPSVLTPYDSTDKSSFTSLAQAWSIAPATPTQFLRRHQFAATSGSGIIWSFPRGLRLAASSSLLVWNGGSSPSNMTIISAEVDE